MISSNELMAMFPELGFELDCEFVIDDGSFGVSMRGFYTPAELRMMCEQCEHANTVFDRCPRTKEARDALIAANERAKELSYMFSVLSKSHIAHINYASNVMEVRVERNTGKGQTYWVTVEIRDENELDQFLYGND